MRKDHIHADAIHGDKTQAEREAALEAFKAGKTAVLVATDVASRGLDIEGLPQVINFDVPRSPEDYVHRSGRTGRAGLTGESISLVAPDDAESMAAIEKLIKKKIERVLVPGFAPNAGTAAAMMSEPRGERSRQGRGPRHQPDRQRTDRPERPERHDRPARKPQSPPPQQQKHQDPIFSKPYEPSASAPAPAPAQPATHSSSTRRPRPVAALLGG
jgi:superfamily II DNA/RNA helicase